MVNRVAVLTRLAVQIRTRTLVDHFIGAHFGQFPLVNVCRSSIFFTIITTTAAAATSY